MFDFIVATIDFGLLLFIILILERSAASASGAPDYRYEACAPKKCGDINISYPFYIQGQQELYCGFSDKFGINCSNPSTPMIHIPENDYTIANIFYQNQTLRVHGTDNCLHRIENVTQQGPFSVLAGTAKSSLHLLSNCTETLPEGLQKYRKEESCALKDGAEKGLWGLAMLGDDRNLSVAIEKCRRNVVVPVEVGHGNYDGDGDYEGILRKGFSLKWTASDCSICDKSGGRCGFNATTYVFACFCPDRPHRASCKPAGLILNEGNKNLGLILGIGVAGGGMLLSICFFICFYKFKKDGTTLIWRMKMNKNRNLEAFTRQYGLTPKCYSYSDIKKMTNSFRHELGKGGYGTIYKGKLPDGHLVAAKLLNAADGNDQDFFNEVLSISRTSHVNVVKLMGFCIQGKKRALVYEYMENGSLEKYIYSQNNENIFQLGMDKLYQISLGVARGLEYLHRGCNTRILHFDIKPHNILLDEDFCPKISDFGMAKQYFTKKENVVSSILQARGTIGYIAPELISRCFGVVSHKSDVYSFGMMILEIVGRRKNVIWGTSHESEVFFPGWAYRHLIIEKDLQLKGVARNSEEDEIAKKVILVGLWCIQTDPLHRPTMSKVIEMLEGNLEVLEIPPKPFFDNSPSEQPSASSLLYYDEPDDDVFGHSC